MKYYALDNTNRYYEFRNEFELQKFLRNTGLTEIGYNHNDTYVTFKYGYNLSLTRQRHKVKYVVFDAKWKVVEKSKLVEIAADQDIYRSSLLKKRWYANTIMRKNNELGFRNGPVPGIHKYGNGSYYRSPKTTQERRIFCDKEHYDLARPRRRRSVSQLANSWDDILRSDVAIKRSWKKNKKRKQWM